MLPRTIKELLVSGRKRLKDVGKESVCADYFLSSLLCCQTGQLILHASDLASSELIGQFNELVARRCANEPVQYILGKWGFLDLNIEVACEALIPRPETEEMAARLFDFILESEMKSDFCFADVCTGSGAIGLALAHKFPAARGWLSDISCPALKLARQNLELVLERPHRISLLQADMLTAFAPDSLDIIVANPPYIESCEIPDLMPEVKDFEPILALDGGEDGLDFIRQILTGSVVSLKKQGILAFEHGHGQRSSILSLPVIEKDFKTVVIGDDLCGRERFLILERK